MRCAPAGAPSWTCPSAHLVQHAEGSRNLAVGVGDDGEVRLCVETNGRRASPGHDMEGRPQTAQHHRPRRTAAPRSALMSAHQPSWSAAELQLRPMSLTPRLQRRVSAGRGDRKSVGCGQQWHEAPRAAHAPVKVRLPECSLAELGCAHCT